MGEMRLPLCDMTKEHENQLVNILKNYGLCLKRTKTKSKIRKCQLRIFAFVSDFDI